MSFPQDVIESISIIRNERDVEKRMDLLQVLNQSLPVSIRLEMPTLLTNAYVRRALDLIQDRVTILSSVASRSQA
jgi:hypothetical protein